MESMHERMELLIDMLKTTQKSERRLLEACEAALDALASGAVDVKPLISNKHDLPDLAEALTKVKDKEGEPVKDVVVP